MHIGALNQGLRRAGLGCHGEPLVWFDASIAGLLQGLASPRECLHLAEAKSAVVDAFVVSPGAVRRWGANGGRLGRSTVWVRADWARSLRIGEEPDGRVTPVLDPASAAQLGADGVVVTLLLGADTTAEADNVRHIARYRAETLRLGLPMMVDLHSVAAARNSEGAAVISLGLNLVIELGADIVALPQLAGSDWSTDLHQIKSIPALMRCGDDETSRLAAVAVDAGYDGVIISGVSN